MPKIVEIKPRNEKVIIPREKGVERIVLIMFKKSEEDVSPLLGKYKPKGKINISKITKESLDEFYDRYSFHR